MAAKHSRPSLVGRLSRVVGGAALCAVMGLGVLGVGSAPPPVESIELEERVPNSLAYTLIPDSVGAPTPAADLDAKLAAFARIVERDAAAMPGYRVEFEATALDSELSDIIADIDDRAQISVHVRDLDSDEVLFDYFGDSLLIPASNQKLVTSAAALDLLGPEYGFHTEVLRVGPDLYIVGHGDPTLDHKDLEKLALEVAEVASAAEFERIIVDDSAFSSRSFAPGFDRQGPGVSYQAPSGALSLNFNTVRVTVYGVKNSSRPAVSVFPPSTAVDVDNRARRGSGSVAIRTRSPRSARDRDAGKTLVEVGGRLLAGQAVTSRRRVEDPGIFTGGAFAAMLADATGTEPLPVERGTIAQATGDPELLAVHESPPLLEIVEGELAFSNNFVAEQLLRTLGWRMTGEPGDWDNGGEVLSGYWQAVGNDPSEMVFENGSGMSVLGRATTSGLVDLMSVAHRAAGEEPGLIDALPIAGVSGTMRARLRSSGKRVRAKTGTMDGVSGLSGVITSEAGDPQVAFSILINVDQGNRMYASTRRQTEDQIVMAVLGQLDRWELQRWAANRPTVG